MNIVNNKKKNKTLNILSNPQFILGSIINPINSYNNSFSRNIEDNIDNEDIKKNKEEKNIDAFFGSIIEKPPSPLTILSNTTLFNKEEVTGEVTGEVNGEVTGEVTGGVTGEVLEVKDINNNGLDFKQQNINQLKQIYPLTISNKPSYLSKSNSDSIFTNIEIKDKIDKLSENELYEIFKIIKNNSEKYSTNKNGIFINVSTLKKITITEISNFLIFCENNNKIFNQEEQTRDIYRDIILDL